jgi:hypothetical protein
MPVIVRVGRRVEVVWVAVATIVAMEVNALAGVLLEVALRQSANEKYILIHIICCLNSISNGHPYLHRIPLLLGASPQLVLLMSS